MTTPDEHLAVLRDLAEQYESIVRMEERLPPSPFILSWKQKADALRWAVDQNAYGVTSDEVVG